MLKLFQCTNLGGMEKASLLVLEALRAEGHACSILTPRPFGPAAERIRALDAKAADHPYRGKFGVWSQRSFEGVVRRRHRTGEPIWITGTDVACLRAVAPLRGPKVLAHHYHHFEGAGSWLRWKLFYELGCRQLNQLTYPSEFTRQEAIRIAPWVEARSQVAPGFFPVTSDTASRESQQQAARAHLGIPADALVVGNAGWLTRRKRWDVFLKTCGLLAREVPEARFFVVGGGPERDRLGNLAAELGIADRVTFTGWTQDVQSYFKAFDFLLFNSDFDTLPRTPGEAMGAGCLVVASLVYGGLAELVEHERNGLLFRQHDPEQCCAALLELYRHPAACARLREAAWETLRQRYSHEAAVAPYRTFLAKAGRGEPEGLPS